MTPFDTVKFDEQAVRQLKDTYLEFVQSLEPPLARLALTYDVFSSRRHTGEEEAFDHLEDRVPVDIRLPFMLAEVFRLPRDDVVAIASSGMFGLLSVLLYDAMFDQQLPVEADRLLLQNLLYTRAIGYWCALFEQASPFWDYHRAWFQEYYHAISAERERHCGRISVYDKGELYEIARGKSAPRKILLAAMAFRGGKDILGRIKSLSASLDACAVADQIIDDISDWEEDFNDQRFSYLLTQLIISCGLENRINADAHPTPLEMMMYIFGSGELQILLDEARKLFEKAIRCVEGLECPEWKQFLRNRAKLCAEIERKTESLIALFGKETANNADQNFQAPK